MVSLVTFCQFVQPKIGFLTIGKLFSAKMSGQNSEIKEFFRSQFFSKYVNIYRSISKLSYIDRYMISNIDRYIKFSKNHFSTDICRKFSFFDRYMKFSIFLKIIIFGSYSLMGAIKTSYIGQYNNAYIGLYKNAYKTLGDLAYIDLYTPYRIIILTYI